VPTPIAVLGFEQGTHAGIATGANQAKYFDYTNGTIGTAVKITTAAARTGTYGLELVASAGTAFGGYFNAGNNGILGASGTLVGHFWFKYPSLPGANATIFTAIGTAGGNDLVIRYVQSTGRVQAQIGGGTAQNGPVLSANTWYRIEFRLVLNANPHTLDWTVDGVAQTQATLAVASENLFKAGWGSDSGSQTFTLYVDDGILTLTSADHPLLEHKVVKLTPDTGGTTTQIGTANATGRMVTNSAIDATHNSANILAAVSELPPLLNGSSSGLGQRTSGTGNACSLPMTTYAIQAGEAVSGLRVVVCAWAANATAAANTLGIRAFNGTAETTLFAAAAYQGQNTTSPAWICKQYQGALTQTQLDALLVRVGYSGDISPLPGVHAVYAEVAVRAPVPPPDPTGDVVLIDSSSSGNTTNSSSKATAALVGGTTVDVVAVYISRWTTPAPDATKPDGFVHRAQVAADDQAVDVFLKRLDGPETGTYLFDWAAAGAKWNTAHAELYRGVDRDVDLTTLRLNSATGTGTSVPTTTLNTVPEGAALSWHIVNESGAGTKTYPSPWTKTEDNDVDGQGYQESVAADDYSASGATVSASSDSLIAVLLELPPETIAGGDITGTGAVTAPAATSAGAGAVTVTGSGSVSAPAAQASGTTAVLASGSGSVTAPAAQATGAGGPVATGAGSASAAASVVSGAGVAIITGTGATSAPAATTSGAGTTPVSGTGTVSAPASTTAGTGAVHVAGSGSVTSPAATVAGTGTVGDSPITGSGSVTAPAATSVGVGAVAVTGSGTSTASASSAAGGGGVVVTGSGQASAPPATVSGIGNIGAAPVTGSGNLTAPAASSVGAGTVRVDGSGSIVTPAAIINGSGAVFITGAGQVTAPAAVVSGEANDGEAPPEITVTTFTEGGPSSVVLDGRASTRVEPNTFSTLVEP
jgi:hypothetical protein